MAAESSRSGASADSYVGSLISLTSKCEIRYEGILYEINTEESSIGLRSVRSFGTEGRKKDGQQIPPSDKIYEHILFRGSDIKDLQVKASPPPVQTTSIYNDPAIIQSHYFRPPPASTSLPPVGSGTFPDPSSHTAQLGIPRSPFQGSLPLYQPGGSLGSWGPSPPPPAANGSGLAMPMYWQGYYAPPGGLPHLQQSALLRPPPGLPIPQSIQQPFQYPGTTASLPPGSINLQEFPPPLQPPVSGTPSSTSTTLLTPVNSTQSSTSATNLPSTLPYIQASPLAPEASPSLVQHKLHASSLPTTTLSGNLPFASSLAAGLESVAPLSQNMPASASSVSNKPRTAPSPAAAYQTVAQPMLSNNGSSSSTPVETSVPLVTPGQLLQPVHSSLPSSQPLHTSSKDLEIKPQEAKVKPLLPDPPVLVQADSKEPILPLPTQTHQKSNGAALHTHQYNRGRGRGRGYGYPRPVTKFAEDFDFSAMNEKFNKDEVWGHLGKNKSQVREKDENDDEADDTVDEDGDESSRFDTKPVYVKDDFFDTISCNSLDHESRNGRTRFSEQLKIDTETFGDFPRQRPIRGGGRGFRGGRGRGSYYGRGYGYGGRGRGRTGPSHPF